MKTMYMTMTAERRRELQKEFAEKHDIRMKELARRFGVKKVTNMLVRKCVQAQERFRGNNIFGEWRGDRYVVTSYGDHWPLFIWESGTWYENVDKYSVTTSKHRSQAHPHEETMPMTCRDMIVLMNYGLAGVALNMGV